MCGRVGRPVRDQYSDQGGIGPNLKGSASGGGGASIGAGGAGVGEAFALGCALGFVKMSEINLFILNKY